MQVFPEKPSFSVINPLYLIIVTTACHKRYVEFGLVRDQLRLVRNKLERGTIFLKSVEPLIDPSQPRGDHFNFVCTEVCGHNIGKLTHPQTKAVPTINKNRPICRLCTIKREAKLTKLQQILFNFTKTTHAQVELSKRWPV